MYHQLCFHSSKQSASTRAFQAEIKSRIGYADACQPYAWFDMGPAGTLLVQRVWPVRDLDEEGGKGFLLDQQYLAPGSTEWDVFDKEARYLGAVTIPGNAPQ